MLFSFKGINGEQFKTAVQAAKNYEDVGAWLQANGTTKTPEEIKAWSDEVEAGSMMNNPEKRAYFIENCARLGLNPEKSTTFDWLEADDRASFPRRSLSNNKSPISRRNMTIMKASIIKPAVTSQTPVFPQTLHRVRPRPGKTAPGQKSQKRDNIFSKSRDNREDRGSRQMKTSHNAPNISTRR